MVIFFILNPLFSLILSGWPILRLKSSCTLDDVVVPGQCLCTWSRFPRVSESHRNEYKNPKTPMTLSFRLGSSRSNDLRFSVNHSRLSTNTSFPDPFRHFHLHFYLFTNGHWELLVGTKSPPGLHHLLIEVSPSRVHSKKLHLCYYKVLTNKLFSALRDSLILIKRPLLLPVFFSPTLGKISLLLLSHGERRSQHNKTRLLLDLFRCLGWMVRNLRGLQEVESLG